MSTAVFSSTIEKCSHIQACVSFLVDVWELLKPASSVIYTDQWLKLCVRALKFEGIGSVKVLIKPLHLMFKTVWEPWQFCQHEGKASQQKQSWHLKRMKVKFKAVSK